MCRQGMHLPAVESFGIGNGVCFLVDPALSEACMAGSRLNLAAAGGTSAVCVCYQWSTGQDPTAGCTVGSQHMR